jgi:hypothetical protein
MDIGQGHTHLAAPHPEGWSYNELNSDCLSAGMKTEENVVYCFLMLSHVS